MKRDPIEKIVNEVYITAKAECPTDAKSAIAQVVSESFREGTISYRTIERAFDLYVFQDKRKRPPKSETIKVLCQYLGYTNYSEYIKKNSSNIPVTSTIQKAPFIPFVIPAFPLKELLVVVVIVGISMVILINMIQKKTNVEDTQSIAESKCMVWAKTHYVEIDCNLERHPDYGTTVEIYDNRLINNFEKIVVDASTQFFSEESREPLIWYHKNKNGTVDYFKSYGLHPVTGKTLDPISEHVIEKYKLGSSAPPITSPPATSTKERLLNPSVVNTPEHQELGLFIFNNDSLDSELAKHLQYNFFKSYHATPYLIPLSRLRPEIKKALLSGDLSILGKTLPDHVDNICIGTVSYRYEEKGISRKRHTCNIQLNFDMFTNTGQQQPHESASKEVTGSGFSQEEAKQNAFKKLLL